MVCDGLHGWEEQGQCGQSGCGCVAQLVCAAARKRRRAPCRRRPRRQQAPAGPSLACTRVSPSLGRKRTAAMMPSVMNLASGAARQAGWIGWQAGGEATAATRDVALVAGAPHPRKPSTRSSGCQANSWPSYTLGSMASTMATHSATLSVWTGRSSTGAAILAAGVAAAVAPGAAVGGGRLQADADGLPAAGWRASAAAVSSGSLLGSLAPDS